MASKESGSRPGIIEQGSYMLRNIEIVVAGIALYFGYLGVAALSAAGAFIDHHIGKFMEKRRLQTA